MHRSNPGAEIRAVSRYSTERISPRSSKASTACTSLALSRSAMPTPRQGASALRECHTPIIRTAANLKHGGSIVTSLPCLDMDVPCELDALKVLPVESIIAAHPQRSPALLSLALICAPQWLIFSHATDMVDLDTRRTSRKAPDAAVSRPRSNPDALPTPISSKSKPSFNLPDEIWLIVIRLLHRPLPVIGASPKRYEWADLHQDPLTRLMRVNSVSRYSTAASRGS
jgi:hypothetical protein